MIGKKINIKKKSFAFVTGGMSGIFIANSRLMGILMMVNYWLVQRNRKSKREKAKEKSEKERERDKEWERARNGEE